MQYKLKCQIHNKISIGNVGSSRVCVDCNCKYMIYCQNEKLQALQEVIEQRLKCRKEIKRIEQQRYFLNKLSKRLESQKDFEQETLNESKQQIDRIQRQYNNQNKYQENNQQQILLDEFETMCKLELGQITNAEFIIHHMTQRKKWIIDHPMQIEQAILQKIQVNHDRCSLNFWTVGNKITNERPLQGYYIVFIHSMIYDGYWKDGKLVDGTISYLENVDNYKSYDANQLAEKNKVFNFNYFMLYHNYDDHLRYVNIHNQLIEGQQFNNLNKCHCCHHKCHHHYD